MKFKIGGIYKFQWFDGGYCYFKLTSVSKDAVWGKVVMDNGTPLGDKWPLKKGEPISVMKDQVIETSSGNFDTIEEFIMVEEL